MSLRDSLLDNFAGDLEYHPRRGIVYLALAAAAFCRFYFAPADTKFTAVPLVLIFGAVAILIKGLFLCRRSSDGLGLTETDLDKLSSRKDLPTIPNMAAQIVQDFGAGPLFLWPFLRVFGDTDSALSKVTEIQIFIAGLILFGLGWFVRYATKASSIGD